MGGCDDVCAVGLRDLTCHGHSPKSASPSLRLRSPTAAATFPLRPHLDLLRTGKSPMGRAPRGT